MLLLKANEFEAKLLAGEDVTLAFASVAEPELIVGAVSPVLTPAKLYVWALLNELLPSYVLEMVISKDLGLTTKLLAFPETKTTLEPDRVNDGTSVKLYVLALVASVNDVLNPEAWRPIVPDNPPELILMDD